MNSFIWGVAQPCICLEGPQGPWSPGCFWWAGFLSSSDSF